MDDPSNEWLRTRTSLLARIRNPDDQTGWREFYRAYRKLVRHLAQRHGLSETEAEDVTQETMITVQKTIAQFRQDPARCSFKSWFQRLAQARIVDFLRRRRAAALARNRAKDDTSGTRALERLADPASLNPDVAWEEAWRQSVLDRALAKLRRRVKPLHYQVFYLHVIKQQTTWQVARALGVNIALVYVVKHRVVPLFKTLVEQARTEAG
jgi:RNA polymerase sigma-70 factor (ECF subfamily)